MGSPRIIVFAAFAFLEIYNVAAQYGRVEYLNQPSSSITAAPIIQPISQFIVPAVIKPLLFTEPALERAPAMPEYNKYPNYPPMQHMPPIIYKDDDDDDWHHLLYFLLFAMRNKGGFGGSGYGSYPPPMPYAFYPVPSGCGGPDRCGCDDSFSGNTVNYIPYPVPVPSSGSIGDSGLGIGDDVTIMQSPPIQALNGRDNEVTLFIRTE